MERVFLKSVFYSWRGSLLAFAEESEDHTPMDINTAATLTRDDTASTLALLTIGKIVAKMFKPKRSVIARNAPAEVSVSNATKPVSVRIMDSIIPLGLVLLTGSPLLAGGDIFRVVMAGVAFVISGFYIFVISTSKS